jgi:capsular exopolysaccharide synthesis family protein
MPTLRSLRPAAPPPGNEDPLMSDPITQQQVAIVERAIDPRVVLFHSPSTREAEQFRGLRNSILAMNPDRGHRTVVMAGSTSGEGTTVSAVNLAFALAELAGTRVLLIDANLRKPGVDAVLALSKDHPGLSDMLEDRVPLSRAIRPTISKSLDALTAGRSIDSPAEVLARGRLKPLLDALKPNYSYIILDTPPVNEYTDASLIARDCDGVILTIRIDGAPRAVVEQSVSQLRSLGANLLGSFVVGTPPAGKASPVDTYARKL